MELTIESFLKMVKEENCEIQGNSEQIEELVDSINYYFNFEDKLDSLITRVKEHIKDVDKSNIDMYLKEKQINHWLSYISGLESVQSLIT